MESLADTIIGILETFFDIKMNVDILEELPCDSKVVIASCTGSDNKLIYNLKGNVG